MAEMSSEQIATVVSAAASTVVTHAKLEQIERKLRTLIDAVATSTAATGDAQDATTQLISSEVSLNGETLERLAQLVSELPDETTMANVLAQFVAALVEAIGPDVANIKQTVATNQPLIQADVSDAKSNLAKIKSGILGLAAALSELKDLQTASNTEVGAMHGVLSSALNETRGLKASVDTGFTAQRTSLSALITSATAIQSDAAAIHGDTATLVTDLAAVKADIASVKSQLTSWATDQQALLGQIVSLLGDIKTNTASV